MNNHYLSAVNIDLNSKEADQKITDTHCIFHLKHPVKSPSNSHIIIGLSSFNIPYSWYIFRDGINNSFSIETYNGTTYEIQNIIIEPGNYTSSSLIQHLNTKFTSIKSLLNLSKLSITENRQQQTFYLTTSIIQTCRIFNIKCHKEMGFYDDKEVIYENLTTLLFPFRYNLSGSPTIYFRLMNLAITNRNSKNVDGILCNIPCEYMAGSYIYYNPSDIHYFKTYSSVSTIEVQILDEEMIPIGNLSTNSPFRFTLSCHFSYNKSVILENNDINLEKK